MSIENLCYIFATKLIFNELKNRIRELKIMEDNSIKIEETGLLDKTIRKFLSTDLELSPDLLTDPITTHHRESIQTIAFYIIADSRRYLKMSNDTKNESIRLYNKLQKKNSKNQNDNNNYKYNKIDVDKYYYAVKNAFFNECYRFALENKTIDPMNMFFIDLCMMFDGVNFNSKEDLFRIKNCGCILCCPNGIELNNAALCNF